jgi:hypothetical protein
VSYAGLYGFATAKLATLALGGYPLRYGPGERTGSSCVDPTIITEQGRFRR